MNKVKKIDGNIIRLLAILAIVTVVSGVTTGTRFVNLGNFQSMAKTLSEYGLMSIGVGVTMIAGGIDLSTVYIANLCGILAGMGMKNMGMSIPVAILLDFCIKDSGYAGYPWNLPVIYGYRYCML